MKDIYESLNQIMKKANRICFFGGAGVSTKSGLLDFRSEDGLYNLRSKYDKDYEEMLSIDYFNHNPKDFYSFYKDFMIKDDVKPNDAHYALSNFDKQYNNISIVTQNIDGLHQLAGSTDVIEIHGSIYKNYCIKCHMGYSLSKIKESKDIPLCICGNIIRPGIVFYGEGLNNKNWNAAKKAISGADILIVGGTSLNVYPATELLNYYQGRCLIIINKEVTPYDDIAQFVFHEDVGEVLSKLLKI